MAVEFYNNVRKELESMSFKITDSDMQRPWGGFFYIDESQAQAFSNHFFSGLDVESLRIDGKLSPKILMVKPKSKLSWQYHNRRAEIWQVYKGCVGIVQSETDVENQMQTFKPGNQIKLNQGVRHRLIGLNEYGVVAEIWQHTNAIPSDEEDIVRIQDDFGR
ncbi:MAG: phosphoheptose isomerase [Flavobacteriaceae bacterium]|nr:phosphoheptose isomerase [Flavobacteriaceae bacterium]